MANVVDILGDLVTSDPTVKQMAEAIESAVTLRQIVCAALQFALFFGAKLVEQALNSGAKAPEKGKLCPNCNSKLESKGFAKRSIRTILGMITWRRRVLRCPNGCEIGQIVPFDETLGISPSQQISDEIRYFGCLLAVFVPYEIAAKLIFTLLGVKISPTSIWNWVQLFGKKAIKKLEAELQQLSEGGQVQKNDIEKDVTELTMAIGGDGVMVPFRPNGGLPNGKSIWREIKIGIFARLKEKITKKGKKVNVIVRKRVVAVLGKIEEYSIRMQLMAMKERIAEASAVIWLSDGGKGYWGVFKSLFCKYAQGILDFYHAVQNLWKGAASWLDGRTKRAREWFQSARHEIRHGHVESVLKELKEVLSSTDLPDEKAKILTTLANYLANHVEHMSYDKFKSLGFPIGSGMVESTCKWLIEQRFKGAGMRWSVDGFNSLLHIRLAWVNEEFEDLFGASPNL